MDQILALATHIEAGFDRNWKTCAVFVELTYDTVRRKVLIYKLTNVIQSRKIIKKIWR